MQRGTASCDLWTCMALAVGWYLTFGVGLAARPPYWWQRWIKSDWRGAVTWRSGWPSSSPHWHKEHTGICSSPCSGHGNSFSIFLAERALPSSRFHWLSSALPLHPPSWASFHLRCELLALLAGCWPRALQAPLSSYLLLGVSLPHVVCAGPYTIVWNMVIFLQCFALYLLLLFLPFREGLAFV